jgi:hypothetical protein
LAASTSTLGASPPPFAARKAFAASDSVTDVAFVSRVLASVSATAALAAAAAAVFDDAP